LKTNKEKKTTRQRKLRGRRWKPKRRPRKPHKEISNQRRNPNRKRMNTGKGQINKEGKRRSQAVGKESSSNDTTIIQGSTRSTNGV
jgi:hypothetical protein